MQGPEEQNFDFRRIQLFPINHRRRLHPFMFISRACVYCVRSHFFFTCDSCFSTFFFAAFRSTSNTCVHFGSSYERNVWQCICIRLCAICGCVSFRRLVKWNAVVQSKLGIHDKNSLHLWDQRIENFGCICSKYVLSICDLISGTGWINK